MNLPKKWKRTKNNPKFKNVKEDTLFNIISEKLIKSILLKMAKIPQTKKC